MRGAWATAYGRAERGREVRGGTSGANAMMGPEDHEEEHNQEGDAENDRDREAARRSLMHAQADEASRHPNWIGSNMDTKGDQTGLRAGTNNFQRKLYGSPANSTEADGNEYASGDGTREGHAHEYEYAEGPSGTPHVEGDYYE